MKKIKILPLLFALLLAGCAAAPVATPEPTPIPLADYVIYTPDYRIWKTGDEKYAYEVGSVEKPILSGTKEGGPAPQIRELYPFFEIVIGTDAVEAQYVNSQTGEISGTYQMVSVYDTCVYGDEERLTLGYFTELEQGGFALVMEQPFEPGSQSVYERPIYDLTHFASIEIHRPDFVTLYYWKRMENPTDEQGEGSCVPVYESLFFDEEGFRTDKREDLLHGNLIDDYFWHLAPMGKNEEQTKLKEQMRRDAWQVELAHAIRLLHARAPTDWEPEISTLLDELERSAADYGEAYRRVMTLLQSTNGFGNHPLLSDALAMEYDWPPSQSFASDVYRDLTLDIYAELADYHWDGMFVFDVMAAHEAILAQEQARYGVK